MSSESNEDPAMDSFELVVSGVFLVLILGLVGAALVVDFEPAKLTAVFIVVFWMPLLILHEVGHALAAAALGWRVEHISLGLGRRLGSFEIGNTLIDLRAILVEGFVMTTPRRFRKPQLEQALIYFAGPGIELVALGILAAVVGPSELLTRTDEIGMLMAQSLAVALLMGIGINLFPHSVHTPDGRVSYSDGLGILLSLQRPDSFYRDLLRQSDSGMDATYPQGR